MASKAAYAGRAIIKLDPEPDVAGALGDCRPPQCAADGARRCYCGVDTEVVVVVAFAGVLTVADVTEVAAA